MAQYPRTRRRRASVSATEAAKNFGELVDRVRDAGVAYVVERKGRPIAQIGPVGTRRCTLADLADWLASERPTPGDYTAVVSTHVRSANRPRVPRSRWGS
jgi:prevent-host-death family protein